MIMGINLECMCLVYHQAEQHGKLLGMEQHFTRL